VKALIIGAGGQLATELLRLAPESAEVEALDITALDVTRRDEVIQTVAQHQPNVVFNASAWTDVEGAETNEAEALKVNGDGPGNLAEACGLVATRLIHISTDFVFDGSADSPYGVEAPPAPLNAYGRTKLAGEQVVRERLGNDGLIIRTSWLYSACGHNFVRTMLRLMQQRDRIEVVADQHGTPTSARSLAGALWRLAAIGTGGVLHWRDGGETTWHGFASHVLAAGTAAGLLDRPVEIVAVTTAARPTAAIRPACSVLDISETEAILAASPRPWTDEVDDVVAELAVAATAGGAA
jgi:dTDP-4-dehydrorhamnose reductase